MPRWTPGPPLSSEEKRAFFDETLATNGGCKLPCWWGITPGKTTWDEMRAFFNERDIRIRLGKADSNVYATLELDNAIYPAWGYGGITFWGRNNLVQSMRVKGYVEDEPSVEWIALSSPNEYLAQYSLSSVLSMYGVPSQIYVSGFGTHSHSDTFGAYNLWVEYADHGILLGYSGYTVGSYTEYLICPAGDGVNEIELWLQSPGSTLSDSVEIAGNSFYWEEPAGVLEEMSAEEFYEAFKQSIELELRGWNPDIDTNVFYQTYVDPNTSTCLEFPEQIEYTCE